MYVEGESAKIIRLAKIKAYGKCDRHMGHMNWDDFFGGVFLIGFLTFFIGIACCSISYKNGSDYGEQKYQSEHPQTYVTPSGTLSLSCINKDPRKNSNQTMTITPGTNFALTEGASCMAVFN